MGFKRYIFKSGLDIIAPYKCGTRWLEKLDVEKRVSTFSFDTNDLQKNIHSGTTFIWRPVREHFHSAIKTEWALDHFTDILSIITEMKSGICTHWYPYLYKELYDIWEKTRFRFHKLRALSELTPSAGELEWTSNMYNFSLPARWDSVESALSLLSPEHTIRLESLISEEEKWLKSMIKSQYSEKDWEAYSNLEDSRLEMLCKVMDLKVEVEQLKKITKEN
jgi:hypothetical protein